MHMQVWWIPAWLCLMRDKMRSCLCALKLR